MSDDDIIFTEEERKALCLNDACKEHGDGDVPCEIPTTKREAKAQLKADQRKEESAVPGLGSAEPKTATAEVVLADGAEDPYPDEGES